MSVVDNYANEAFLGITIGEIIDVDDPHQMGRIRVYCPNLGDSIKTPSDKGKIPFAGYMTPFGGSIYSGEYGRGPEQDTTPAGQTAYGMWAIPQVGGYAVVACIDGDVNRRIWLGCMYKQSIQNTLPAGRHHLGGDQNLPMNSADRLIEPLLKKAIQAFGAGGTENKEWLTRGAEYTASIIHEALTNIIFAPDSIYGDEQAGDFNQGYVPDKSRAGEENTNDAFYTDKKYRYSPTTSITTPGLHTLIMDDRDENCRVRIKSTGGNQIILDDTNERIYISAGSGNAWIEIDESGTIDVYSKRNISMHAEKDINFTAKKNINLFAENLNVNAKTNAVFTVGGNVDISSTNLQVKTSEGTLLTGASVDIKASGDLKLMGGGSANLFGGSATMVDSGGNLNLKGGNVTVTGGAINLNGPGAASASKPTDAAPTAAAFTSRVPAHEPWPRTMTKDDTTHEPQFPKDSENVNRVEREDTITRNEKWRR